MTQTNNNSRQANRQEHIPLQICTHHGMTRRYCLTGHISKQRSQNLRHTSKRVNEARQTHTFTRPGAFDETKTKTKRELPPHPDHTTKSTAARWPRPDEHVAHTTSPFSLSFADHGFMQILLAQLSYSVMMPYQTDRTPQADMLGHESPCAPRHE